MNINRDDFSVSVKRILAERAGFLCSHPNCKIPTVYPSVSNGAKSESIGVACHIAAAAPGGPRYDALMTPEQRSSINNGIWLCQLHARAIDSDEKAYPVELLHSWKLLHEDWVSRCAVQQSLCPNYLKSIRLIDCGRLQGTHDFLVYKNNVFYNSDSIGKSMIFDLLSGLFTREHIDRWLYGKKPQPFICEFTFVERQEEIIYKEVLQDGGRLDFYVNGHSIPDVRPKFNMIYLAKGFTSYKNFDAEIPEFLGITVEQYVQLVDYIHINQKYFVRDITFDEEKQTLISVRDGIYVQYDILSGSERQRFLIEMAFQLAKISAMQISTLFVIDKSCFYIFDSENLQNLLTILSADNNNFQVIIITNELVKNVDYSNFHICTV